MSFILPGRYQPIIVFLFVCVLVFPLTAQMNQQGQVTVRWDLRHDLSSPLRELAQRAGLATGEQKRQEVEPLKRLPLPAGATPLLEDPVRQRIQLPLTPLVTNSFEGLGNGQYGFSVNSVPPDTNGAVGRTQYVQWVNTSFAVFDKATGSLLMGPAHGNTLWSGFGGACESRNNGDPIAIYDKLANRWVMSQFTTAAPYMQCIAVSASSDATGAYYRYAFTYSALNDYPKMGVWPDAYYETFNMFQNGVNFIGAQACAYDRNAMLAGHAAMQICHGPDASIAGLLPADVDGTTPPPPGSPNYMLTFGTNSLKLYVFHVDFQNPANSTFIGPNPINVAAFYPLCGGTTCVPQPNGNLLDSLADRLMYRLAYRNFGWYESLVVNHSVMVSGGGGVRWYELRNPSGIPIVAQQGTFAPDSVYRWMGSIAMDKAGDIAVGFSKSSSSTYPSVAFAGRVPHDPTGTLEPETAVVNGSGSQTTYSRWGDYSAMTVDPVDDCTFWYTQEYEKANGVFNWNTRIVNFRFPYCTPVGLAQYDLALAAPVCNGLSQSCDSGPSLLLGRDNMSGGAEPHQPNTIRNSCSDGSAGTFHVDESLDRLQITAVDGVLRPGQVARVTASVWVADKQQDAVDFYYTNTAPTPVWTYLGTIKPKATGAQNLSTTFRLDAGTMAGGAREFPEGWQPILMQLRQLQRPRRSGIHREFTAADRILLYQQCRAILRPRLQRALECR